MYYSIKELPELVFYECGIINEGDFKEVIDYNTMQHITGIVNMVNSDLEFFLTNEMFLYDNVTEKTFCIYSNKLAIHLLNYNYNLYCIDLNLKIQKPSQMNYSIIYKIEFPNGQLNCKIIFKK